MCWLVSQPQGDINDSMVIQCVYSSQRRRLSPFQDLRRLHLSSSTRERSDSFFCWFVFLFITAPTSFSISRSTPITSFQFHTREIRLFFLLVCLFFSFPFPRSPAPDKQTGPRSGSGNVHQQGYQERARP